MCIGGFNDILYNFEKEGGKIRAERKIRGFRQMIEECLIDLNYQGKKFTWINKRESGVIKERIDRVLVNLRWLEEYPRTQVFNLSIVGSDHLPILVNIDYRDMRAPKQFKFEIIWIESEECGQIIKAGWEVNV